VSESRSSRRTGRPAKVGLGAESRTSIVRTALSALVVVAGIAWIALYQSVAKDGQSLTWMGDLGRWNYLIGFGLIFVGLALAAHPSTPLGRGRGVVVGMLGCFLIGLLWIVMYYIAGQNLTIPVLTDLSQYNLVVGIGFMAVGFIYATHWE
jgi:hypothetical protein